MYEVVGDGAKRRRVAAVVVMMATMLMAMMMVVDRHLGNRCTAAREARIE